MLQKSMSLKYEPASEPLHISELFPPHSAVDGGFARAMPPLLHVVPASTAPGLQRVSSEYGTHKTLKALTCR